MEINLREERILVDSLTKQIVSQVTKASAMPMRTQASMYAILSACC